MDEYIWADIMHSCKVFAPAVILVVVIVVCLKIEAWLESKREG